MVLVTAEEACHDGGMVLFTAASATAILRPDLELECVTAFPAEIPLDEAALLLNDLIGGPCVGVTHAGADQLRGTDIVFHSFHIGVLAADVTEAMEVLHEIGDLARSGRLDPDPRVPYAAYRWHEGDLVPVISRWHEGKTGAIGQAEWADA